MKAKETMEVVAANLKSHKWHFTTRDFHDGEYGIDTDIASHSKVFKHHDIRLLFRDWDMLAIYYLPIVVPENARNEVAAYLSRANWRTKYGEFLINLDDGEIRVTFLVYPSAIEADVEDVMCDVFGVASTIDHYAGGLLAVITGAKSAADAFAEAEKKIEEDASEPPSDEGESAPEPEGEGESASAEGGDAGGADDSEGEGKQVKVAKSEKRVKKESKPSKGEASDAKSLRNYSLKGLNIQGKVPLEKIVAAVKKFKAGRRRPRVDTPRLNILLSGAPGSGKTAFVNYLAKVVGMPLRRVRASDLLSRFSGETEQKIAEVFERARKNGEMIFLDEIDSFLQDRTGSSHPWEVTQVNELLQQMEDFGGVMIGATNFADNLDKAVLRRFTYKLKLDYLTDEGKGEFFKRYFKAKLTEDERQRLNAIANLTPGDFRTVREELFYLSDRQTNSERLEALEAESQAKGLARAKIGF